MRKALIVSIAVVALTAAACGGDTIGENLAENILENELGGDVDINIDGDGDNAEVNIETDEGSFSFGGGEIPDELDVPVPTGGDVLSAIVAGSTASVGVAWPASEYETLVAFYEDWTAQQPADYEKTTSTFESDDGTFRNTGFFSNEANVSISIGDCYGVSSGELDSVCLNITEDA